MTKLAPWWLSGFHWLKNPVIEKTWWNIRWYYIDLYMVKAEFSLWINSLWPSDTIWWHRPGSTLVQVMACCLMAPSHYMKQYWVIISEILWHSPNDNFYPWYELEHYMMTSSNGNICRITGLLCGEFTGPGEFPAQRPVTWSFDVFFHLRLNKRLSKQSWGWWFETPSRPLWRQCND